MAILAFVGRSKLDGWMSFLHWRWVAQYITSVVSWRWLWWYVKEGENVTELVYVHLPTV